MFGLVVTAYVISSVGIPIYLHYCGGELEEISYVVKGNNCCDGEEDHSQATDDGCCKDENVILKNNPDFTLTQSNNYNLVKTFCDLFYVYLPFSAVAHKAPIIKNIAFIEAPPERLQNTLIISTSVLRI